MRAFLATIFKNQALVLRRWREAFVDLAVIAAGPGRGASARRTLDFPRESLSRDTDKGCFSQLRIE